MLHEYMISVVTVTEKGREAGQGNCMRSVSERTIIKSFVRK